MLHQGKQAVGVFRRAVTSTCAHPRWVDNTSRSRRIHISVGFCATPSVHILSNTSSTTRTMSTQRTTDGKHRDREDSGRRQPQGQQGGGYLMSRGYSSNQPQDRVGRYQMYRSQSQPQGTRTGGDRTHIKEEVEKKKASLAEMQLAEKRQLYKCGRNFKTLKEIPTWSDYISSKPKKTREGKYLSTQGKKREPKRSVDDNLNSKVSIWRGDITVLEIDAIGNAANSSLMGGGGVDGCIHSAAGSFLKKECTLLDGCDTGDAKITSGYKLPAKHVIHTVGPIGEKQSKLESCYERCLTIVKENKLRSLAMPCVSTGIYGYPGEKAAPVAIQTVRDWLETDKNADLVDRIIFCLFLKDDVRLYEEWMPVFFPLEVDDPTSKERSVDIEEEESKLSESKSSTEDRSPKAKIAKTEERTEAEDVSKETSVSQGSDAEKAGAENDKSNAQSAETLKEEGTRETENGSNGGSVGEGTVTQDVTGTESAVTSPDAVEESTDKEVATGVKEVTTGVEEVTTGVKEGTEAKDETTEVKEEMAEGKDVTPEEQSQSEQTKTEECSTTSKDTEIMDQENGDPEKEHLESRV